MIAGSFGEGPRFVNGWAKDQYVIYKSPSSDLISFEEEALEQSQPWVIRKLHKFFWEYIDSLIV